MSIYLSGCWSTPLDFFSNEKVSTNVRNQISSPYVDPDRSVDSLDNEKIKEYVQELETMRPQLLKVIEMEQDLSFMIEQIASFSSLDNKARYIQDFNQSQEELKGIDSGDFSSDPFIVANTPNDSQDALVSTDAGSQNVRLVAAPTISKFSDVNSATNLKTLPIPTNNNATSAVTEVDSKFSQLERKANEPDIIEALVETKDQSGIHLVSVSKKSNLPDFWNNMLSKYPDILADKRPLVELVNVNGKQFYSLRVGPYSNDLAKLECKRLSADGTYCGVVNYQGQALKL